MIDFENIGQVELGLVIGGTISTTSGLGVGQALAVAPFAGVIRNIRATLSSTSNGTFTTTCLLGQNGTVVSTITFAGTPGTVGIGTPSTDPITVSAGDRFTLDVSAIGNQPKGIYVGLLLDRQFSNVTTTITNLTSLR